MKLRRRALAFAAAGSAAFLLPPSTPAFADTGVDLSIRIVGASAAPTAGARFGAVSVTNAGDQDAYNVQLTVDVGDLDEKKVTFGGAPDSCGDPAGGQIVCTLQVLPAGRTYQRLFYLGVAKDGLKGSVGSLAATVSSDNADAKPADNETGAKLSIRSSGPSLLVYTQDVTLVDAAASKQAQPPVFTGTPIPPGGTSVLAVTVLNQGNATAKGVTFTVALPEHVTLEAAAPGCAPAADKRSATCTYKADDLLPWALAKDAKERSYTWPIRVDAEAPGPVELTGGTVSVAAIATQAFRSPRTAPDKKLPEVFAEAGDNVGEYAVVIGAAPSAAAAAGAQGGAGPESDAPLWMVAGGGVAVVALGAGLLVFARRRQVTLEPAAAEATPTDPAADPVDTQVIQLAPAPPPADPPAVADPVADPVVDPPVDPDPGPAETTGPGDKTAG